MSHTPGPWTPPAHDKGLLHLLHSADGRQVAIVSSRGNAMEQRANARLIAAAPELLAALKQVQEWLLEKGQLEDDGITHPLMLKANNLAVAAIAKAEGTGGPTP